MHETEHFGVQSLLKATVTFSSLGHFPRVLGTLPQSKTGFTAKAQKRMSRLACLESRVGDFIKDV